MQELIKKLAASSLREEPLQFEIGDTVDVHTRIQEGDKERIQIFSGIVIARSGGGSRENFTVRRIVAG
ncbi:MAG: 50S ribosomal protein L19, partial [Planctomycetota bacterium]